MRRALDWCLDNRPRFVLIAVVVVGLLLAVPRPHAHRHLSLAPGSTTTSTLAVAPSPSTTTVSPAATVAAAPATAPIVSPPAPSGVQAVCVRFLRAWATRRPQPGYSEALRPLAVGSLYAGLAATDPAYLPTSRVGGVVSSVGDATGGTVVVATGIGNVTCSVVPSGAGGWLVQSFDES